MADHEVFELTDVALQSGVSLPRVELAYKTYGELNPARDNVVLMPTYYGADHVDTEAMIGAGHALDPARYFIVVPNLLGNGLSSSPSNTPPPFDRAAFPNVTVYDNVACQHRLVREHLGIDRLRLVTGFSMGAQQAFQWGALHSDMVDAIAPFCGSARTSPHNRLFLDSVRAALVTDAAFAEGRYEAPPAKGLRAFSVVYTGWAFSQDFFREEEYRKLGMSSVDDVVAYLTGYFGGATRTTCWRCCGRGGMRTSAPTTGSGATSRVLSARSRPARSCCRARRISTSACETTSSRSPR